MLGPSQTAGLRQGSLRWGHWTGGCAPLWWTGRTSGQGDDCEGMSLRVGKAAHNITPTVCVPDKPTRVQGKQ